MIIINGNKYREKLLFGGPVNYRGQCDEPGEDAEIRINMHQTEQEILDTFIHEYLHASDWENLSEEYVSVTARDIAKALWEKGYRRV